MNYKRVFIQNSIVHIIVVAYNRKNIFINQTALNREAIKNAKKYFSFKIIAFCILNDHIHLLLKPENIHDYPKIITSIKYYFSKHYAVGVETPTYGYLNKGEKGIFQHRFYEHTITTQEELNKHIDYIHYNPMKHYNITPKDWEFSSFHKYVKSNMYEENWCNFEDINKINDLIFE